MFDITISDKFKAACQAFVGGMLTAKVVNSPTTDGLWQQISIESDELRAKYDVTSLKLRPSISATRNAYRAAGKDPSRYRPASEQLARRVLQGKELYSVDTLVDLINAASLRSGYAMAALDADMIEGQNLVLDIGRAGEPYEGIGRGQLNIENLPVYRDGTGAFATPTSDSVRTRILPSTHNLLVLVNGYDGNESDVSECLSYTERLLLEYASASECQKAFYSAAQGLVLI